MRIFVFHFLFLWTLLIQASEISIKTIIQNGKPVYLLGVKAFGHKKEAEEYQKKLSVSLQQPVIIYHPDQKSLFLVQVGPLHEYALAKDIQQQLEIDSAGSAKPVTHQNEPVPVVRGTTTTENSPPAAPSKTFNTKPEKLEGKVWNLRNADIRAVIAEVSRITGKNFLIDPRVQGKISIVSSKPMSDSELYQVFLSMLQISGYAAIPSGKIVKIIPNIDAKTQAPDALANMMHPPRGDDMMVQVIPVNYVPSEQLVPVLRPLMPQWSSVSAYGPSNMLILSGRAENIKQLAKIIKQVDTSSASGIEVVPLRFALAMDVANTLKDLMKSQAGAGIQNQPVIAVDDRNNSILISGSKTDRLRLHLLISQMDRQSPYGNNSNTQVIYLSYLRAADLVPILAGIAQANFSGSVGTTIGTITRPALDSTNPSSSLESANATNQSSNSGTSSFSTPESSGGGGSAEAMGNTSTTANQTQTEGGTKPTVQIIGEPNTNSIIINGPITLIRTLKSVIAQLDIKPAQILIEAMIAEINETDAVNLGLEWGSINQGTRDNTTFRPGFAILNTSTKISNFQVQINALARQNRANILSTPSVMVLDNRQAKILIGKQVSVASTSYPNNAGGTTTASPFTTFDRVNVALHLYVRPQITRANGIQMQIDQGNDTLSPGAAATAASTTGNPTFDISAIVTAVHVESGDVVVLGGLRQHSLGNDDNKLPIIGDLPGIGRMFQRNITSHEKKVLMVFIRPLILRTESDAVRVSGGKYNIARQDELSILRNQYPFEQRNNDTVLAPLQEPVLPRPFCCSAPAPVLPPPGSGLAPNMMTK